MTTTTAGQEQPELLVRSSRGAAAQGVRLLLPNFAPSVERVPDCYDPATLTRLQAAVRRYDPDGVLAIGRALLG